MWIFISILGGVLLFTVVVLLPSWHDFNVDEDETTTMTFERFKTIYPINPDRWRVSTVGLSYRVLKGGGRYDYYDAIGIRFSFVDWIRYQRFARQVQKEKEYIAQMKVDARVLAALRQDIAAYQKQLDKDVGIQAAKERVKKGIIET